MSTKLGDRVCDGQVRPEWIDLNRHMNVAYYVMAFDLGIDALWDTFGITHDYVSSARGSTFAVESHVTYQRELSEGDRYVITTQILGYDEKRIHQFQRLYHAGEGFLAATCEWMNLHVDLRTRRVSEWPPDILQRIAAFANAQKTRAQPAEAGRVMRIPRPIYTV